MPTTTLSDLPPELIVIVFKSFGEFTLATALVPNLAQVLLSLGGQPFRDYECNTASRHQML